MTEAHPDPGPQPGSAGRGQGALILDRSFGTFFWGKLSANVGIWIFNVASVLLVFEATRSPMLVGLVSVAQFAPQIFLVAASGAAADRGNRKLQLLAGRLLCILGSLSVWIGLVVAGSNLPVVAVLLAALTVGLGFTVGGPAMQALLPSLVREAEVPQAVALDNFSFAVGRAIGPMLGGLLAVSFGLVWAFVAATLLHLVFAAAVLSLPGTPREAAPRAGTSVRAGLAYVRSKPQVAAILLGVGAIGIGTDPAITLAPSVAAQVGGGSALVGYFASAFGLGAFVVFFAQPALTRRWGSHRLASVGLIAMAAGALALVLVRHDWPAAVAFGLGGAGMTLALTALGTELYARVPEEFRGRVMALWLLGFVGSRPLAGLMNGLLAERASLAAALVSTACVVIAAAWACRPEALARDGNAEDSARP